LNKESTNNEKYTEYGLLKLISRIARYFRVQLDKDLSQNNLTISQFKVLAYLWEHGEQKINQKMIHEFLEIKPSSLTKSIRILLSKDLIRKETDSDDFRSRIIMLTEKGMEIKKICKESITESEAYLLQDLSGKDINTLTELLLKIKKKIKH
jgi:DNA-binding MarR family transcriptional regulator